ncbi:MAG: hypothetical protein IJ186_01835 [Bacilli bacterium]|nr:hypothetical protein [Bacilli bacterium]
MKTFLKFSGAISAVLALVAFILMMATPAVTYTLTIGGSSSTSTVAGVNAIFGSGDDYGPSWAGLMSWIFVLVSLLILVAGVVLPLLKVKALQKFAGVLNLLAVLLLVASGIFMFCEVPAFQAAAGDASFSIGGAGGTYGLGAGWVIGAILSLGAGAVAILPTVMDFVAKK